jgi:hypothetical protein
MDDFLIFVFVTACLFAGVFLIWDGANGRKR